MRAKWLAAGLIIGLFLAVPAFFLARRLAPAASVRHALGPPAVVHQIRQLSELVSVRYTVQQVVGLEEKKVPFGSEKLLLFVQAEVLGGTDLSELARENVRQSGDLDFQIRLPEPRILNIAIDDEHTKVWDRRITWWTPWIAYNPDLERQARLKAREQIERTALEMGILKDARRNAETAIGTLLRSLGARSVVFIHGT
jgi:hypothetical protein